MNRGWEITSTEQGTHSEHTDLPPPAEILMMRLTLFPRRRFRRALSPRRVPSARPLRLAPWASGVAPGLIRTARARATIVQESAKCENTDVCNSWRPFLALERSSEKAFKNAKHMDLSCSDRARERLA